MTWEIIDDEKDDKFEPEHWVKIHTADDGHHEMLDNMQDVLNDMDIDCYNDMELARKNQCDLYVILEKR